MGIAAIKLKIMPSSPETDLENLKKQAKEKVISLNGKINCIEEQPVAFGLKAGIGPKRKMF